MGGLATVARDPWFKELPYYKNPKLPGGRHIGSTILELYCGFVNTLGAHILYQRLDVGADRQAVIGRVIEPDHAMVSVGKFQTDSLLHLLSSGQAVESNLSPDAQQEYRRYVLADPLLNLILHIWRKPTYSVPYSAMWNAASLKHVFAELFCGVEAWDSDVALPNKLVLITSAARTKETMPCPPK